MMRRKNVAQKSTTYFRVKKFIGVLAVLGITTNVMAFEIDTDNSDVKVNWDNTVKYNVGMRTSGQDASLTTTHTVPGANLVDGDNNFKKNSLVTNRLDLLSEFEMSYKKDFGLRVTGAAWYDSVYRRANDNTTGFSSASFSAPNQFAPGTKTMMGQNVELLDAFVYGKTDVNAMPLSVRAGRFTQIYGETLFFGSNGVAAAQGPIDLIKLLAVPGSQFKEILRPVGQVAGQLQVTPSLTLGGYVQLEWEKNRLPAAGSFLSMASPVGAGSQNFFLGFPALAKGPDDKPSSKPDQFGAQLKFKEGDYEYGLYYARWNDKDPQLVAKANAGLFVSGCIDPTSFLCNGTYSEQFAKGIQTVGTSVSTLIGDTNVAAELSFRKNMPIAAPGQTVYQVIAPLSFLNSAVPKAETAHFNISSITVMGASSLWQGAVLLTELAANRVMSVKENPLNVDPNSTKNATAVRAIFEPQYFQVFPGVDMSFPIGIGYGLSGKSAITPLSFSPYHGGDLSLGAKFEMDKVWRGGLTYNTYFGSAGQVYDSPNSYLSYKQPLRDRSSVTLTVQRTF